MAKIVKKEKIKSVDNPALLKIKLKSAKEVGEFAENIINTVREPLIALDKDLRVVKASQSFYDFFKVTPEETIGTLIYNLGNNQWDIPKLRELLETILPEKTTFDNFEVEHVFSTIGKRIMLLNARKIQSGSGKEQIILLAIEDITERKLAEEELAISEIRYRGLFESAKDGILILDSETGRIVDVNPILINMLGYSKEQFIDKTIWEIGIFKDIVANQDNYVEFQKKGYNRYEHLPLETKDGRRIDIEFVSHVNIAHQQKVTQCNIRDITEHKQIEELLRESEVKYRLLSELSPEMIYLFDLKGCITYINKAGGAQFRVNPSEIVGKDITDVFPPDIANQNLTAIQKVIDTKTPFYNEREMKFPFGNMWVSTRLSPVFDKEYQVVSVLGLSIDITQRKHAEEAIKENEERFNRLINSTTDMIFLKDDQFKHIVANIPLASFYGKKPYEIIGLTDFDLSSEGFAKQCRQSDLETLNTNSIIITEETSGDRYFETTKYPVKLRNNKVGVGGFIRDITKRKQVDEAFRESQSLYYSFIEQLPNAVFRKDLEDRYVLVNSQFCWLKGLKKEDFIGKTPMEVAASQMVKQGKQGHATKYANLGEDIHKLILQTGKFFEKEEEYSDMDGGIQYMHVVRMPVFDSTGTIIGTQGIMFDITERKQAEDALRKGEVELNEAQRLGQIGSWDFDAAMGSITRSKEYYRVYGLDPKINRNDFQEHLKTYTSESSALLDSAFKKCLKTGEGYQLDLEKTNADGTSSWITERGEVKRDDKGKIVGIRGTAQDITDRKHAELEITMLAQSLKSINECVSITDMEDKILFVNESFLKTYGFNENELVGNQMSIVRSPNNLEELVKDILPATISGGWKGEVWNKRKDGTEFPISLSTTTVCDKNGTHLGLIGVASDITERKRAENELINAKEQAESASKLKDAFIANISHEIRTPLNGILGMTALIKDIYQSNIKKEDEVLFEGIDVSSHRIIRTIDMILNYSRLHVGEFNIKPDKINISLICANLVKEFNTAAKNKSLDLSFQNNCGDTAIFADEFSISMAISNLIDNAIKFTNKGFVKLILNKGIGDEIILEVKDTGIGIDKDYLNYIFEPYRQEQMEYGRAYEGIGLGLAIVKKVLSLNKCSLNVESQKGEGSTFSIYFGKGEQPLENKSKTGIVANILPSPEKLRKVLVLLVEDDLMNQVTIKKFIENRYNVIVTDSSDEALEILKKKKVDIILMDISIRGKKNGLELTKELKESKEFSHIPVIAVTAHAFEADRQNALKAGCDSYLAKPFTKESLLNMIANYAHK